MTKPLGAVARLGLIVPTTNTVNEPEWAACLPPGVSMHVARMPLHTDAQSAGGKEALRRDITVAAQSLADADVDVIAYGCTAGSTILPLSTVPDMIREAAGRPGVATAPALVHALMALGARRVVVATPYDERMNRHERDFLQACGLAVLRIEGLGAGDAAAFRGIHRVGAEAVLALVGRAAAGLDYDALVLSCTDLPTQALHNGLEARLGRPVVTSNQATLWAALQEAGLRGGWGLLAGVNGPGSAQISPASGH
jgi:maleate cis-trans isomerase